MDNLRSVELGANPGAPRQSNSDGDSASLIAGAGASKSRPSFTPPTALQSSASYLAQGRVATALSLIGMRHVGGNAKCGFQARRLAMFAVGIAATVVSFVVAAAYAANKHGWALAVAMVACMNASEIILAALGTDCLRPGGEVEALMGDVPADQEAAVRCRRDKYVHRMVVLFAIVTVGAIGFTMVVAFLNKRPILMQLGLSRAAAVVLNLLLLVTYQGVVAAAGCTCLALALMLATLNARVDSAGASLVSQLATTGAGAGVSGRVAFDEALERHMDIRQTVATIGARARWSAVVTVALVSCVFAFVSSVVTIAMASKEQVDTEGGGLAERVACEQQSGNAPRQAREARDEVARGVQRVQFGRVQAGELRERVALDVERSQLL